MLHSTKSRSLQSEENDSSGAKVLKFDPTVRQRRLQQDSSEGSQKARLVAKLHGHSKAPKSNSGASSKGATSKKAASVGGGTQSSWGGGRSAQYHGGRAGASMARPSMKSPNHRRVARKAPGHHPVRLMAAKFILFGTLVFAIALVFRGCIPGV